MIIEDYYVNIIDTQFIYTRDAAVVSLLVSINGDMFEFTGSSRRHPLDKPNKQLATILAYSRAYNNLAYRLQKRAKGQVKHVEDVLAMKHDISRKKSIVRTFSHPTGHKLQRLINVKSHNSNPSDFKFDLDNDNIPSRSSSLKRRRRNNKADG